jgi:hypothetical protein
MKFWIGLYAKRPVHGPQAWRWFQVVGLHRVELKCYDDTHLGWRLLLYTRWRVCFHLDWCDARSLMWQHLLDSSDAVRKEVFEGRLQRP